MTQIVESLFGVSPERYQQQKDAALQQEALAYAQLNPMQRAEAGIYAGARQLGSGIGRMLGGEDPGMRRVTEQDQIIRSINLNDPETYGPAAQRAYQMGHTELAQKIMLGADTAYQRQEVTRQRAAQMQSRQQTQAAQQLIPSLMTPGRPEQVMIDEAADTSYLQKAQAAGIDQNILRQLMATPAGRAELKSYIDTMEATRGKRTTIAEGGTVIEEDPLTGAVRTVATGGTKPSSYGPEFARLAQEMYRGVPLNELTTQQFAEINKRVDAKTVAPASFGTEFTRIAAGMFAGVPLSALTGPQIEAVNKRVDQVKASTAPKVSVDLSDPTATSKARLEVMTKWEGVLKSGGDVELSNRYNALQSSVALANKGNSVADGATIYNLAKMYDPSGAVQEGDKKSVVGNPSVPQRVQLLLQQLAVGGSFTPEQRKNMLKIADELVEQRENALKRQAKNYTDIVKNFGGNAEDIYNPYTRAARPTTLADVITPLPAASAPAAAAAARPQAPPPAPAPQPQAPPVQPAPMPTPAPAVPAKPPPAPATAPALTDSQKQFKSFDPKLLPNGDVEVTLNGQLVIIGKVKKEDFESANFDAAREIINKWILTQVPPSVAAMPSGPPTTAAPQLIPDNVEWTDKGIVIYTNPNGKKVPIGKANTQAQVFNLIKTHEAKTK